MNLAVRIEPPLAAFGANQLVSGIGRPTVRPNAWVAAKDDPKPRVKFGWPEVQRIRRIHITFDTDFDHPLESVLMGHPEREIPFCVKRFRLSACGRVLAERENHSTHARVLLEAPIETTELEIEILETRGLPAAIFEVRIYGD